ncbi:MAG: hypothetical protein MUE47_11110, partial [Acidobacteria bacterium]|nr:hypothetical protein [Acidobacteriota bacterium]
MFEHRDRRHGVVVAGDDRAAREPLREEGPRAEPGEGQRRAHAVHAGDEAVAVVRGLDDEQHDRERERRGGEGARRPLGGPRGEQRVAEDDGDGQQVAARQVDQVVQREAASDGAEQRAQAVPGEQPAGEPAGVPHARTQLVVEQRQRRAEQADRHGEQQQESGERRGVEEQEAGRSGLEPDPQQVRVVGDRVQSGVEREQPGARGELAAPEQPGPQHGQARDGEAPCRQGQDEGGDDQREGVGRPAQHERAEAKQRGLEQQHGEAVQQRHGVDGPDPEARRRRNGARPQSSKIARRRRAERQEAEPRRHREVHRRAAAQGQGEPEPRHEPEAREQDPRTGARGVGAVEPGVQAREFLGPPGQRARQEGDRPAHDHRRWQDQGDGDRQPLDQQLPRAVEAPAGDRAPDPGGQRRECQG